MTTAEIEPRWPKMGIAVAERIEARSFTAGQQRYLEHHRDLVFLAAQISPRP